jgi:hypothetical protein
MEYHYWKLAAGLAYCAVFFYIGWRAKTLYLEHKENKKKNVTKTK